MIKKYLFILLFIIIIFNYQQAYPAGIYENANQSAEFIRTLTRYSSTDIDAAFYNPAGAVFLQNGFYAYFSNQMLFDYFSIEDTSQQLSEFSYREKYNGEAMTWSFPDIYTLYKHNNYTIFMNLGIIGRGAAAAFEDSIPEINKGLITYSKFIASMNGDNLEMLQTDGKIEAYAFFVGATVGGAYKINNRLSAGGGIRYIHAEQNTKIHYDFKRVIFDNSGDMTALNAFEDIDIDVNARGNSFGFIGSFNLRPIDEINIGLRYEYYTCMKVKNEKPDKYQGPSIILGNMFLSEDDYTKMTLPMNAAIGISYQITPVIKVEGSYVYYFNRKADWGEEKNGDDISKKYDNGYDASISFEYAFLNNLKGSFGYSHTVSGINSKTRSSQQLGLDGNAFAVGGTYSFTNNFDLTVASMIVFFDETTHDNAASDGGKTTYNDRVYNIAVGAGYKLF